MDGLPGQADGNRRLGEDLSDQPFGLRQEAFGSEDSLNEPDLERFLGGDQPAREQQIGRPAFADQAR